MRRASRAQGDSRTDDDAGQVLIGRSPQIIEVYKTLAHATLTRTSVLIQGESGSGKSLVARAIHENGGSRGHPFVSWAGLPTSSVQDFEAVKGSVVAGTLYIEEVARLSPLLQSELLHELETKRASFRLIAATQANLDHEVRSGRFRDDLYYLLRVITIDLPSLRERIEDLPALVDAFVARYATRNGKQISHVSPDALSLLSNYSWPGNIRELEHAIERAIVMTNGSVLFKEDFPTILNSCSKPVVSEGSLEELERQHILRVLTEAQFNKSKASEVLGIDRATLYRKAQRYGIDLKGR